VGGRILGGQPQAIIFAQMGCVEFLVWEMVVDRRERCKAYRRVLRGNPLPAMTDDCSRRAAQPADDTRQALYRPGRLAIPLNGYHV